MANNSRNVIEAMLAAIEREITVSLRQINESPEWFDESFEQHLLRAVNSRTESTCSKFRMELRFAQRAGANCATEGLAGNSQVRNDSNPLGGRSGPSIKVESIGEVIELSDDEEGTPVSKIEIDENCSDNNIDGNELMETPAGGVRISNNQSISNGESAAIESVAYSESETETEIANDMPSTSSGKGASTNVGRLASVVELRRCDKAEGSSGTKNEQKTAENKRKRHNCQFCGFVTLYKSSLNVHIRKHTGERPYQCNKCSKSFNQPAHLKAHQLIHVKQYKFRCVGCARGFNEEIEKVAHDKVCEKRRYECYLCKIDPPHAERMFVTNVITNLEQHMRTHTGEKPFRCKICMKRFQQKGNLNRHLDTIHSRAKH